MKHEEINLLGRDLEGLRPHVDLLVDVHAGNDEEHAGPPGAASQQPAQPEDHGSLILLKMMITFGACVQ